MSFKGNLFDKEELHKHFKDYRLNRNDESAKVLYIKYRELIYSISFSILKNKDDSEDIVQSIFLKLYKLDIRRLPKKNEFSWLYTVTKNESINLLKKNNRITNYEEIYNIQDTHNISNEIIETDEYNRLIKYLSPEEEKILSLKIVSGMSFKDISKALSIPINVIEWKYYKSIKLLKQLILSRTPDNSLLFLNSYLFSPKNKINYKKKTDV